MREGPNILTCDCGYLMTRLAKHRNRLGIDGYVGFVGLPGTVAGAAINNAGCYGSLASDKIISVEIIQNRKVLTLSKKELAYSFRNSVLKRKEIEGVVLTVCFDTSKRMDTNILEKKSKEYIKHRKEYQEHIHPNLGSVFCELEFHRSIIERVLSKILIKSYNLFVTNVLKRQLFSVKVFWLLNPAGHFKR